jgi:hypothetical protein
MATRTTDGRVALARGGAEAVRRAARWWERAAGSPRSTRWEAARDATASFHPGRAGLVLEALRGTFLVTEEGDPADHVLARGDVFRAASSGRVAAWALEAGALEVRGARR